QALDTRAAFGVVAAGPFVAGLGGPGRSDSVGVTGNLGVPVRLATAVDEPRDVAADRCVAHGLPVQDEAPDAAFLQVLLLAAVAFLPRDLLSGVVDDARVLGDRFECIDTPARDARLAPHNRLERGRGGSRGTRLRTTFLHGDRY